MRRMRRTHPALFPLFRLDRIYWDVELQGEEFHVHRSRLARVASDHLPVVARLRVRPRGRAVPYVTGDACRRPNSQRHGLRAPRVAHAVQRDHAAAGRPVRCRVGTGRAAAGGTSVAPSRPPRATRPPARPRRAGAQASGPRGHAPVRAGAGRLHRARRLQPYGRAAPDDHGAARAGAGADRGPHDGRRGCAQERATVGAAPLRVDAHRRRWRDRAGHRLVRGAGRATRSSPDVDLHLGVLLGEGGQPDRLRRILGEWQARGEPLASYAQLLGTAYLGEGDARTPKASTRCSTRWGTAGLPTPCATPGHAARRPGAGRRRTPGDRRPCGAAALAASRPGHARRAAADLRRGGGEHAVAPARAPARTWPAPRCRRPGRWAPAWPR